MLLHFKELRLIRFDFLSLVISFTLLLEIYLAFAMDSFPLCLFVSRAGLLLQPTTGVRARSGPNHVRIAARRPLTAGLGAAIVWARRRAYIPECLASFMLQDYGLKAGLRQLSILHWPPALSSLAWVAVCVSAANR